MTDTRLNTVAALVRRGSRLADIGTDHAHLPVAVIQAGICPSVIASDIRSGPVSSACRTVQAASLEQQITVRMGDGLSTVSPDEVDDIVIAGMGGETIAAILDDAPWVRDKQYHLVLQPMTHAEALRRYLYTAGFSIECEETVSEGNHCYTVMSVLYTDTPLSPTDTDCLIGAIRMPEGAAYLDRVIARLKKQMLAGQEKYLAACLQEIENYRNAKGGKAHVDCW